MSNQRERNFFIPGALRGKEPEEVYLKAMRRHFIETMFPYPLTAMKDYNHGLKEEEQYKATDTRDDLCHFFKKLGFIRLLHFVAEPKYPKSMPSTSDDTTKHFYARIHQKPNRDTHVDYCKLAKGEEGAGVKEDYWDGYYENGPPKVYWAKRKPGFVGDQGDRKKRRR
ncbi:hypothetical protein PIB30_059538 [Stylosanthes scabra]|uniref:Uncharacterized protein n=2 Tax=Stylosanthes scabra TaxID=79078 RepID=A0ABU6UL40_9FABA|nr:hypothetical protein [Stylosanthes scabra]